MKTKLFNSLLALLFSVQLLVPSLHADFINAQAYGADVVAGYASLLKSSLLKAGQEVIFVVEKPDTSVVRIPATADVSGFAQADFYGLQTKKAGVYKVSLAYPTGTAFSPQNIFRVFPDSVSVSQSFVSSSDALVEAKKTESTFVTVTLYDQYRNPVSGHHVKLISSRGEDLVEAMGDGRTDEYGKVHFKVQSIYPGVSTYSALDLTENQILTSRAEVVFTQPVPEKESGFFADIFRADIGQGITPPALPGPIDHFEIEGLPSTAKVGQELSMTVIAKDKDNNVAKNYTGTILISAPEDENAQLPSNGEYTFKESDQGQFSFDLALVFTTIGEQSIQVFDKNNWKISGERAIEIVPSQAVIPAATSDTLSIKAPADGAQLGNSRIIISGQGKALINLKVFDNDTKIGDTETDGDGFFSFDAQNLEPGSHTFYVMSDNGEVSKSVTVQIDTIPPVITKLTINPEGSVNPGQRLTVELQSEPELQDAKVRVQGIEEVLNPSATEPGIYEGVITAPERPGQYPIDIVLVDGLSNKGEYTAQIQLFVEAPAPEAPAAIQNLNGVPGDKQIKLVWDTPLPTERPIQKFRIHMGTTFDFLTQTFDVTGAASEALVSNLNNGTQYFFAVSAVDSLGIEGTPSVTIAVTPKAAEVAPTPVETLPPVGDLRLSGTPTAGGVILQWSPSTAVNLYAYKIYFGLRTKQYDDYVLAPAGLNAFEVKDLINGLPYFFSIVPVDSQGAEISGLSAELSLTPGTALRPSAPSPVFTGGFDKVPSATDSGPEAFWIISLSIAFALVVRHHKRRQTV